MRPDDHDRRREPRDVLAAVHHAADALARVAAARVAAMTIPSVADAGGSFLGRADERDRLARLVSALAAGEGGTLLIEGEQGIGKTALLHECMTIARERGCQTRWARADQLVRRFPLSLVTDCLGALDLPGPRPAVLSSAPGGPASEQLQAEVGDDPQATDLSMLLLANRCDALTDTDQAAAAVPTIRRALILGERMGSAWLTMARTVAAGLYVETGKWDDALAELELAGDQGAPVHYLMTQHGNQAFVAAHRDDRDLLAVHLQALESLPEGNVAYWSNAHFLMLARAMAAEQAGRPADAATALAQCLEPAIGEDMPSRFLMLPPLVRLALGHADRATATAATEAAEADARRKPHLKRAAQAAGHCREILTGDAGALRSVAGYYGRTGRPLDQAMVLEDHAVIAAAAGDHAAARASLAGALRLYGDLGARWDIRRARDRLREYGVRQAGAMPARPSEGWTALTTTEIQVARLVARGLSNPEIAAELFLSRNTVQTHVSHILAKLHARSRAEIVARASARR